MSSCDDRRAAGADQPGLFVVREAQVLSMFHDGTRERAAALAAWVCGDLDGGATASVVEDGAVVQIGWRTRAELVEVAAGQALVRDGRDPACWRVYGGDQFSVCFRPGVRVLPACVDEQVTSWPAAAAPAAV